MHIVLIRGLVREKRHWGHFPKLIEKAGFKCSLLEIPGVGERFRETSPLKIEEYVTDMRFQFKRLQSDFPDDEFIAVAISMGGMIVQKWLSVFPQDYKSAIIINSSGGRLSPIHKKLTPQAIKTLGALFFANNLRERTIEILELTTNMIELSDRMVEKWTSFEEEYPVKRNTFLRQLVAAANFRVPAADEITKDILFLCGKKDALVNHRCTLDLAAHYGRPYFVHPEAGHDLPLDDPDWIISHIKDFLK